MVSSLQKPNPNDATKVTGYSNSFTEFLKQSQSGTTSVVQQITTADHVEDLVVKTPESLQNEMDGNTNFSLFSFKIQIFAFFEVAKFDFYFYFLVLFKSCKIRFFAFFIVAKFGKSFCRTMGLFSKFFLFYFQLLFSNFFQKLMKFLQTPFMRRWMKTRILK